MKRAAAFATLALALAGCGGANSLGDVLGRCDDKDRVMSILEDEVGADLELIEWCEDPGYVEDFGKTCDVLITAWQADGEITHTVCCNDKF